MNRNDSENIATEMAKWFRKPYCHWWLLADFVVVIVGLMAAAVTQIWWLLFIPALALTEAAAVYIVTIFSDVLRARDAEIERLRRESSVGNQNGTTA